MKYELTFLLPDEAEIKTIKSLIASFKGKVEKEETWGKKTLMYTVKKYDEAYYYHWLIDVEQSQVNELKKKLNFNEKLIRYLLLNKS